MKVLFHYPVPFSLAHGGTQIQIEQTLTALRKVGVDAEPMRWYDASQSGDVIHHFGRVPHLFLHFARQKGIKVVLADLLSQQGSRPLIKLAFQRQMNRVLGSLLPRNMTRHFGWESYRQADACIALTPWEGHLMTYLFNAPPQRVHIIPNGVEDTFLSGKKATKRGNWLVCTSTITPNKGVLELAKAAVQARTPLWVLGRPYSSEDAYAKEFVALSKLNPDLLRYEGAVDSREALAEIYRDARGFALFSLFESLSLSTLEAAACGCPLLLSDLPWARRTFKGEATYCPINKGLAPMVRTLRTFYDEAPSLPIPTKPLSWVQVAERLKKLYEIVLAA